MSFFFICNMRNNNNNKQTFEHKEFKLMIFVVKKMLKFYVGTLNKLHP